MKMKSTGSISAYAHEAMLVGAATILMGVGPLLAGYAYDTKTATPPEMAPPAVHVTYQDSHGEHHTLHCYELPESKTPTGQ